MTPVLCQTGAYGSVPAFPCFPPEPDEREQFGALLETSRWSPAKSQQHQKAISTVGSGTEDALLWHAESRPSPRHAGMGQLVPSSAVLSQHRGIQAPSKPGTAFFFLFSFFFSNGIWSQPKERRHPFAYPHLQLLWPPPCHVSGSYFWSADKAPSVRYHVSPSHTGHGTASKDESPFTGQRWQGASAANFRLCQTVVITGKGLHHQSTTPALAHAAPRSWGPAMKMRHAERFGFLSSRFQAGNSDFFWVIPCCRLSGDTPLMGSLGLEHRKRCCWLVEYMAIQFFFSFRLL